jgi:hypothetical protein
MVAIDAQAFPGLEQHISAIVEMSIFSLTSRSSLSSFITAAKLTFVAKAATVKFTPSLDD